MASDYVNVRLPRALHARISATARSHQQTIPGAISRAFDVQDEAEFWAAFSASMTTDDAVATNQAEANLLLPAATEGIGG